MSTPPAEPNSTTLETALLAELLTTVENAAPKLEAAMDAAARLPDDPATLKGMLAVAAWLAALSGEQVGESARKLATLTALQASWDLPSADGGTT